MYIFFVMFKQMYQTTISDPTAMLSIAHSSVPRRILKKPFSPFE